MKEDFKTCFCISCYFVKLDSGKTLLDYLSNVDTFSQSDGELPRLFQTANQSDSSDSERSYCDLINKYKTSRKKSRDLPNPDEEKADLEEGDSPKFGDAKLRIEPEIAEEGPSPRRKFSEMSSFDEIEIVEKHDVPLKHVIKWMAQLALALEKLHALGVICRLV